ncbi:MAG: arginyltransferase [Alphaproteobacteria bacterium]|nr:arginyltransferase [Alphaproteobacteria bacterium]
MDIRRGGDGGSQRGKAARQPRRALAPDSLVTPFQQFFASAPVACPYVAGRVERKLIVELAGHDAPGFYDDLSRAGFRRSHHFAYRPACRQCSACVPVRIDVAQFTDTRSTRRLRNLNRDHTARVSGSGATPEQFRLFMAYQRVRHSDSDMAAMSYGEYRGMVEDTPVRSAVVEFRDGAGRLAAVSLIDRLDDGLSAVYSFYDPAEPRRSLGTWSILWLVDECRRLGLPYVYLGYWIPDSPKMAYKARFTGLERLVAGGWIETAAVPVAAG